MNNLTGIKKFTDMNRFSRFVQISFFIAATLTSCNRTTETNPPYTSVKNHIEDAEITQHVKSALHQNDLTKGYFIEVVTLNGDVRITGILDNQAQIDEALRVARAAEGAHTIHDELTIKK